MKQFIFIFFVSILGCSSSDTPSQQPETPVVIPPIVLTDEQLLDQAQKDALKYFWDYAEPNSKLARERYHTDNPSFEANIVKLVVLDLD